MLLMIAKQHVVANINGREVIPQRTPVMPINPWRRVHSFKCLFRVIYGCLPFAETPLTETPSDDGVSAAHFPRRSDAEDGRHRSPWQCHTPHLGRTWYETDVQFHSDYPTGVVI